MVQEVQEEEMVMAAIIVLTITRRGRKEEGCYDAARHLCPMKEQGA
jgi:hypothetical protein